MEALVGFVAAGLALAGSPGPATISLTATGAAFGARRGVPYLMGIVAGMIVVMAVVATGVTGLLLALPGARPIVGFAAAAYFIFLAVRIALAPPLAADAGERAPPRFLGGVFLSLINPKGYAAMAALFSGFVLAHDSIGLDAAAKISVMTAIIVAVNVVWLVAGAALTGLFRDPATNRIVNVMLAILLVASVAAAFLL